MRKMIRNLLFICSVVCFPLFAVQMSHAQEVGEMWVKEVSVTTVNGLSVTVSIEGKEAFVGEDLPVFLRIENHGKESVYRVKKGIPDYTYRNGRIVAVIPNPEPINSDEYDFSFDKIAPGEKYSDTIVIPGKLISEQSILRIVIGLAFVSDITGIDRRLKPGEDPMVLKGPLTNRIEEVVLGTLRSSSTLR